MARPRHRSGHRQVERVIGAGTTTEQRVGDPLFAQWYANYTYSDANGDGIIQLSEVTVDSRADESRRRLRQGLVSIQNGFDLFSRRLRITAMFDYKGGGNGLDGNYFQCSSSAQGVPGDAGSDGAAVDAGARRRADVRHDVQRHELQRTALGYFMSNQFWKFRELSAIVQLAESRDSLHSRGERLDARVRRAQSAHVVEASRASIRKRTTASTAPKWQNDFNTSPPPTYFTFRLNLKY